jgi:hypothetical protein
MDFIWRGKRVRLTEELRMKPARLCFKTWLARDRSETISDARKSDECVLGNTLRSDDAADGSFQTEPVSNWGQA